jgi:hypothetical protein
MIGRQTGDQSQLFSLFNREERIPARHLRRRIHPIVTRVLADLREKLKPFHRETGRPSIDSELMLKMLIVGYCHGIRFERKLCEEVELPLAYRWFCRLALNDKRRNQNHDRSDGEGARREAARRRYRRWNRQDVCLKGITPHIPAGERYQRADGIFPCTGFAYDAERDIYLSRSHGTSTKMRAIMRAL